MNAWGAFRRPRRAAPFVLALGCQLMGCDAVLGIRQTTEFPEPGAGADGAGVGGIANQPFGGAGSAADPGLDAGGAGADGEGGDGAPPRGGAGEGGDGGRASGGVGGDDGSGAVGPGGGGNGGGDGGAGPAGGACGSDADACAPDTCRNALLDENESAIDCGGPCGPCPSAWTPLDMPGLALWLEPEGTLTSSGGRIEEWRDRSRHAHRAVQVSATRRPVGAADTRGGAEFDGVDDSIQIADHSSLRFGTENFIAEVVFSHTTSHEIDGGGAIILSKQDGAPPYTGIGMFANRAVGPTPSVRLGVQADWASVAFSDSDTTSNDGKTRLVAMHRFAPTEFSIRVNGEAIDSFSISEAEDLSAIACQGEDLSSVPCPICLGGACTSGQNLRGTLREIVVVRAPTETEVSALETYLIGKYDLAP